MNSNQRMKGLSLKVGPLGENDRLLTILSEENGISRLAIPRARKPKSRLGATSPFNFQPDFVLSDLTRVIPTSTITAPSLTIDAVTNSALPKATIRISADRVIYSKLVVLL